MPSDKRTLPAKVLTLVKRRPGFEQKQAIAAYWKAYDEARSAAEAEGARAECARVKAVFEQMAPGHEALIERLMYDGKTTGPEAAMAILQAKKRALFAVVK